jgi:hypothetical protein
MTSDDSDSSEGSGRLDLLRGSGPQCPSQNGRSRQNRQNPPRANHRRQTGTVTQTWRERRLPVVQGSRRARIGPWGPATDQQDPFGQPDYVTDRLCRLRLDLGKATLSAFKRSAATSASSSRTRSCLISANDEKHPLTTEALYRMAKEGRSQLPHGRRRGRHRCSSPSSLSASSWARSPASSPTRPQSPASPLELPADAQAALDQIPESKAHAPSTASFAPKLLPW